MSEDQLIRIYLDDIRHAPQGWYLARSIDKAIELVDSVYTANPYVISLDFDMGVTTHEEPAPTGVEFLKWVIRKERKCLERESLVSSYLPEKIYLHTANPIGRSMMQWYVMDIQEEFGREYPEAFR